MTSRKADKAQMSASSIVPNTHASGKHSSMRGNNEDFFRRVYEIVAQIPFGKVTTYGHIAAALGAKSSARLVGYALNAVSLHERTHWLPCHRVINRNGELSGKMHFATPTLMRELLEAEGIRFKNDAVLLREHLWIPPSA
jgi:methylated-DNA-protein-cysteine methyltransferase-like protein